LNQPSLYGITNSNRDFSESYYWGKNQFNSSFPVALACYMRDKNLTANYVKLTQSLDTKIVQLSFDKIFNTDSKDEEIFFAFESRYLPFEKYVHDDLKPIDLVVRELSTARDIRPIEIKLTTLPDNNTAGRNESEYGSEIVVRSPTMMYLALSLVSSCENKLREMRDIFEPVCHPIRDWDNIHEISNHLENILECLENFFTLYLRRQRPFLMQPIWKTIGKSSVLADNCLDIFMWSDFALSRLFMTESQKITPGKITRPQRAAIRLCRFLYDASKNKKVYQQPIYDGMTYDTKNDKEFAISGERTNSLMKCNRLTKPIIKKSEIKNIVLGGGQKYLSPERRFDAILFFSKDLF